MKNIAELTEWITRNPELAEKYYPEIMKGLAERIKNSEPYLTALIIQKLPDHFPNWKTEAEKHFGIKRTKMIQGYIDLIKVVISEYEYPSEIEQKAVESVRAELTEQLEYWNKQIDTSYNFDKITLTENKPISQEIIEILKGEIEFGDLISRAEKLQGVTPPQTETETVFTDTIEKYLCEYKQAFLSNSDYHYAVETLNSFFNNMKPKTVKQLLIKRGHTKQIGFALGEIWRSKKTEVISYEYLIMYKQLFSNLSTQRLEKDHIFSSPLYKYSISKT